MVSANEVTEILQHLMDNNIRVWLQGGWGIDALLSEQTRPHKDLDLLVMLDDIVRLGEIFKADDYSLKEIWSENLQVVVEGGIETATAFVLRDPEGRELDLHAMRLDSQGNGIPAWQVEEGFIYNPKDLSGEGMIVGFPVRCITAEKQMVCHTGYILPDKQVRDLELLREKFGLDTINSP